MEALIRPGTGTGWPPVVASSTERGLYQGLSVQLKLILWNYGVHYDTWARISESGLLKVWEFARYWQDSTTCRNEAPTAFKFDNFNETDKKLNLIRLVKAWEESQEMAIGLRIAASAEAGVRNELNNYAKQHLSIALNMLQAHSVDDKAEYQQLDLYKAMVFLMRAERAEEEEKVFLIFSAYFLYEGKHYAGVNELRDAYVTATRAAHELVDNRQTMRLLKVNFPSTPSVDTCAKLGKSLNVCFGADAVHKNFWNIVQCLILVSTAKTNFPIPRERIVCVKDYPSLAGTGWAWP
jgi:hypothetical protein